MKRLLEILLDSGGASEEDTEYDGAFSYASEWHSFSHGVSDGSLSYHLAPAELPADNPDIAKEPHYYKGGYLLGTLLQLLIIFVLITIPEVPIPF